MITFKRILKLMTIGIVIAVVLIAGGVWAYLSFSVRTGKAPESDELTKIEASPNYRDGSFHNLTPTSVSTGESGMLDAAWQFLFKRGHRTPSKPLPTEWDFTNAGDKAQDSAVYVTWFGHSAVLLNIKGTTVMLDPMLGKHSSPVPLGGARFTYEKPIPIDDIPPMDIVIISHDHYDHLDHESITKLDSRVGHYIVSLGVGSHLRYWGVAPEKITEMDWWDTIERDSLTITAAPARHFSGRSVPKGNPTLWSSWVIKGEETSIYFSADGGYSESFKEIGERFGPFDFTLMECGQYNERWAAIHMMPEQTVRAHRDVGGAVLMPVHWGAFNLSLHDWFEPPERLVAEANRLGVTVATPVIGQTFAIDNPASKPWWREIAEIALPVETLQAAL